MKKNIRLLHTSDWHLGRTLCGRRRGDEFTLFLDWLLKEIAEKKVDVLLIAGDIFDSPNPSAQAQELYYKFLSRLVSETSCSHAIIIAGNHDSTSLLNAPADLLKAFNIHISGRLNEANEVLCLKKDGTPFLIVAAVPYPRDRDLRESLAGESPEEKEQKLIEAISQHYQKVGQLAENLNKTLAEPVPIVGMGHLFATGGSIIEGDGVRNLYVGSLGRVPSDAFPNSFNYLALGHLHQPQVVGGNEFKRYSGAPLAHAFSEIGRPKSLTLIDFYEDDKYIPQISLLEIPLFQKLAHLAGDWAQLESGLENLIAKSIEVWAEVEYNGLEIIADLREKILEKTTGSKVDILRIQNKMALNNILNRLDESESLANLNEDEVFLRKLDSTGLEGEEYNELLAAYEEIVRAMREES